MIALWLFCGFFINWIFRIDRTVVFIKWFSGCLSFCWRLICLFFLRSWFLLKWLWLWLLSWVSHCSIVSYGWNRIHLALLWLFSLLWAIGLFCWLPVGCWLLLSSASQSFYLFVDYLSVFIVFSSDRLLFPIFQTVDLSWYSSQTIDFIFQFFGKIVIFMIDCSLLLSLQLFYPVNGCLVNLVIGFCCSESFLNWW